MGNTGSIEKLWKYAKVNLTPEELKNKSFLVKDDRKELSGSWQQSGAKQSP